MKNTDTRVVAELRKLLDPNSESLTDSELLEVSAGTFLRAQVDLAIAMRDLKAAINKVLIDDWNRVIRFFGRK